MLNTPDLVIPLNLLECCFKSLFIMRAVLPPDDLEATVEQAQHGNAEAVGALYQRYADAIYRYIYYRVDNAGDAEDLTAEVFIRMMEGLPNYRFTGAPFEAWLFRIASARVIDYRRRQGRRPQAKLSELLSDDGTLPEDSVLHGQEIEALRRAFQQFSGEEQTVLILRFVERKSHREVADILGKSETAVKSIQHRALAQLASLFGLEAKQRHYLRGESS
jgi:RNA polymerase sigma-70 factor (ECF subfamily)